MGLHQHRPCRHLDGAARPSAAASDRSRCPWRHRRDRARPVCRQPAHHQAADVARPATPHAQCCGAGRHHPRQRHRCHDRGPDRARLGQQPQGPERRHLHRARRAPRGGAPQRPHLQPVRPVDREGQRRARRAQPDHRQARTQQLAARQWRAALQHHRSGDRRQPHRLRARRAVRRCLASRGVQRQQAARQPLWHALHELVPQPVGRQRQLEQPRWHRVDGSAQPGRAQQPRLEQQRPRHHAAHHAGFGGRGQRRVGQRTRFLHLRRRVHDAARQPRARQPDRRAPVRWVDAQPGRRQRLHRQPRTGQVRGLAR